MAKSDYYIGLDIGTTSVGWAVVNEDYTLRKFKKMDMWGVRLFDEANPAADRRQSRVNRRRTQRRKQRIDLLQGLFAEEIAKIDPTFFIRLNESRLYLEDKTTHFKHPLFNDETYTDRQYYHDFPTIYHLRKELMDSVAPHDIRLVYLALHHIIKNRGHFLVEGSFEEVQKFEPAFERLVNVLKNDLMIQLDAIDFAIAEAILKDSTLKKKQKEKKLKEEVFLINSLDMEKELVEKQKTQVDQVCKFLSGCKGDFKKLVGDDSLSEAEMKTFALDSSTADEMQAQIEKNASQFNVLYESLKAVFDWRVVTEILGNVDSFSEGKIREYDYHHDRLQLLRKLLRKYAEKDVYRAFFNDADTKNGYSAYIGSLKKNGKKHYVKGCTPEDFYKNLKSILAAIEPQVSPADREIYAQLRSEAEDGILLPLLRSKNNSSIPRQIHQRELEKILQNAVSYLPFLGDTDEDGLTVTEKILSIFTFRIPYYVGPLSRRHEDKGANVWIERKAEGRIYPWNFEQKVDLEKSNEEFINRLTNQCTYLPDQTVLPKRSLLYSEYMVLNELNNLKIRGERLSPEQVDLKQSIFRDLFMAKTRVTAKQLLAYLQKEDPELTIDDLSGFDGDFKTSLNSYLDFKKKVFGDEIEKDEAKAMAEQIISWLTIYDDDKKMIRKAIGSTYPGKFNEEQMRAICSLRYSGWGNFSEAFLCHLKGADKKTGEVYSIIEALRNTNYNLMELLSDDRFTFSEELKKYNEAHQSEITSVEYDSLVADLYVSPACKRGIWQTVRITEEIKKIIGYAPKKIFVEMTREHRDDGRKASRKENLIALYKKCEEDTRDWLKEIEGYEDRDFNSRKLFLYYLQKGKCMYSGEPIDLETLLSNNSLWDRDHIYPQSKIKDDSLDNLVLVNKVINAKKDNEILSEEIQKKMKGFWKQLLKEGFISKEKYNRLTRTRDFDEGELSGFLNRQLVETGQMSKAVAELMQKLYKDAHVVYVKAGLVSQFRQQDLGVLKSRRVNDYHHAKDAYLNVVVGDMYDRKFTSNPAQWMKKHKHTNYSINQVFLHDYRDREGNLIWEGGKRDETGNNGAKKGLIYGGTIELVRQIAKQNKNIRYTEYTYCEHGQLYKLTLMPKTDTSITIPVKKGLPAEKYGGYKGANTSYFAFIEFEDQRGRTHKQLVGVPIYVANMLEYDDKAIEDYLRQKGCFNNVRILCEKIKKNALLSIDGYAMRIRGETGWEPNRQNQLKNNMQLILSEENEECLRRIEKYLDKKPSYEPNPELDGFDAEKILALYDELTEKLLGVYRKRPANQGAFLRDHREDFIELKKLSDKAKVINEIIRMLRTDARTTSDLSLISGKKEMGSIKKGKDVLGASKLILINQSVTGLFETRTEL